MKRMLINATHTDEIRVAIADGQKLYDLDIDSAGHYRKKGNIYKAKITRVEPSLEACFVNYGSERHGFLPYKEISPLYCKQAPKGQPRLPINKALKEGDEIIVQVNKEERGNKGAALSTYISLAGRYLVYMPGNHRAGGISRQIKGEKRTQLQNILSNLEIPKNDGVIVRTAGLGCSPEELQWDFTYLKQVWQAIGTAAENKNAPFFIYQESDLFIRALRDYLQPDIGEILIDDRESYEKAREFMQQVMPHNLKKLSHYNDTTPLFSRYQIERQIQSAFEREVKLPSGGSIVIDHTEALLSIDINSARATKGADVEATATHTNLEAADEIARQLRIRDLGGLVVIDFIDMRNHKNQREVENRMRAAADIDRARVQVGKISKFGLLEMSRQRLRSSISDSSQVTCPTCSGHGFIRSMESLVISIIRLTEEEMIKPKTGKVVIQAPMDITNKILNEKRTELNEMEKRHKVQVAVISNENLSFPAFHVQRYNVNEANINVADIELVTTEDCHKATAKLDPPSPTKEKAILQMVKPDAQAPKRSLALTISSWFKSLFSSNKKKPKHNSRQNKKPHNKKHGGHKNKQHNKGPHNKQGQQKGKPQHNKQGKPQHGNKKPQHNKQQGNKQQPNNKQQQPNKPQPNQKQQQGKPQHNKQQPNKQQSTNKGQQQSKPQDQQTQQGENNTNQGQQQSQAKPQQNKQQGNKKPRGKSIYGNKNRGNKNNQKPNDNNASKDKQTAAQTEQNNAQVANKMTRPLGSVAELAAKKEAQAAAQSKTVNKATDQGNKATNDSTSNNAEKPAAKKPGLHKLDKAPENKSTEKKPVENKSDTKPNHGNKQENKSTAKQKPKTDAPRPKKQPNAQKDNKATSKPADNKSAESNNSNEQKPVEKKQATQEKVTPKPKADSKKVQSKKVHRNAVKAVATGKPGIHKLTKPTEPEAEKKSAPQVTDTKPANSKSTNKKPVEKKTTKKKTSKKKATKKTAKKASKKTANQVSADEAKTSTETKPTEKKKTTKKAASKKKATKKAAAKKTDDPAKAQKPKTEQPKADKQPDMFNEAPAQPPKEG
ncbi:Rne/Rng family ribonuclease [Marinicella rhabdoformis]|uniref:Rne/Rng family ribonuclease n=1 Tax=Marinicella rhabdoformis TaxID=2580566 RepID=UPI001C552F24|nr:Rne/Rng family ribonuclease [Marinicella rhabdoformis]